jgi:Putative transposase
MWSSRFPVIWPRWCCRTRRSSTISCFALLEVARNPKRLGAEIGFFSVLHRWSQKLETHPHVHCVVPAGGWSPDHTHWVWASERFFLPMSCCVLTLSLDEFLRRFLLHVLPKGFARIRHFGFPANRKRATNLPLSFQLLGCRRCGVIA